MLRIVVLNMNIPAFLLSYARNKTKSRDILMMTTTMMMLIQGTPKKQQGKTNFPLCVQNELHYLVLITIVTTWTEKM